MVIGNKIDIVIIVGVVMAYLVWVWGTVINTRTAMRRNELANQVLHKMHEGEPPCNWGRVEHIPMPNTWGHPVVNGTPTVHSWKCSMCGHLVTEEGIGI